MQPGKLEPVCPMAGGVPVLLGALCVGYLRMTKCELFIYAPYGGSNVRLGRKKGQQIGFENIVRRNGHVNEA